jgi:hypothetical protein
MKKQADAFPLTVGTRRCTYSVPTSLAHNIATVAKRMNVSQSALIATVLEEPLAQLAELVADIPPQPTGEDVKRLRGKSVALIRGVVDEALRDLEDLAP